MNARLDIEAVDGIGEILPGDDLGQVLAANLDDLRDGDVVVVTSKVVSKATGRVSGMDRERAIEAETAAVVARRGQTTIARTRHGFVLAAAGVDGSNVKVGSVVLLPQDPDGAARLLREDLLRRSGVNVGVVVTDTAGRAWRRGQTDIAVGCAGLAALRTLVGQVDQFGNPLAVTAPAVADEIAGAAELVTSAVEIGSARPASCRGTRAESTRPRCQRPWTGGRRTAAARGRRHVRTGLSGGGRSGRGRQPTSRLRNR